MSLVESSTNIVIGFITAVAANAVFLPLLGYQTSLKDDLSLATAFCFISLVRGYALRRLFNRFK